MGTSNKPSWLLDEDLDRKHAELTKVDTHMAFSFPDKHIVLRHATTRELGLRVIYYKVAKPLAHHVFGHLYPQEMILVSWCNLTLDLRYLHPIRCSGTSVKSTHQSGLGLVWLRYLVDNDFSSNVVSLSNRSIIIYIGSKRWKLIGPFLNLRDS